MYISEGYFNTIQDKAYDAAIEDVIRMIEKDDYCDGPCKFEFCDSEIVCLKNKLKGILEERKS